MNAKELQNISQNRTAHAGPDSVAKVALNKADARSDYEASVLSRIVAEHHDVTPEELFHHSRSRAPIATTRQIAMYLMHVLLGRSLTCVGEFYARDRTTVAHACARIEDLRDDQKFDDEISLLEDRIWDLLSAKSPHHIETPEAFERAANDE